MLYADESQSPHGLERMMAVFVELFGAFGLTISESKTETMYVPIPRASAMTQITFDATGKQYCQTISFAYWEGVVTKTSNLSVVNGRRIRAEWISFRRHTRVLYDRPKESLLVDLKARMVKFEVEEAHLYGCCAT